MNIFTQEQIQNLTDQYQSDRFVPLPQFLIPTEARDLLDSTEEVSVSRVICNDENVSWGEQTFQRGHPAFHFFERQSVLNLVSSFVGKYCVDGLVCWTSKYQRDEHIDPHRDRAGTIQFLLCLEAPRSPIQGGDLVIADTNLQLAPGDAVAFEATKLEHYTTPLLSLDTDLNPRRTVLVGRYFMR